MAFSDFIFLVQNILEQPLNWRPRSRPACDYSFYRTVREFDKYCKQNGFVAVYYRVPEGSVDLFHSLKKKSLPIGEEAVVDLTSFSLEGGQMKTTRSAMNRLTSEGFLCNIYEPPLKE